jgi:hypothetical protein
MGPRTEPMAGADLRLSLDLGLQRELTAALATALPGQRGALGGAVALDPRTGQLLALASLPTFDNNIYGPPVDSAALRALADTPGSPLRDHATGSSLPPGSTFKLVAAAADLCHRVLPPTLTVPTGASFTLGGHTFNNWRPFGPMDLVGALAWSNDVYFYQLATVLGSDAIIAAAALGVGRPSGIDLPDESPGYLGTPESVRQDGAAWYPGSTVILGIGQGYLADEPIAGAIGRGIDPLERCAHLVVDIGGGTAEVTACCYGGILAHRSCRVAGDEMTLAVTRHREQHHLLVGERTALGDGVPLLGGGSLARGFAEGLERAFGFPVTLAERPLTGVAEGAAAGLRNRALLAAYAGGSPGGAVRS